MPAEETRTVIVIGAGISGLTAAFRVQGYANQSAVPVKLLVVESTNQAGGLVHSERVQEALFERGPESFLPGKQSIMELIQELEIGDQVIESSAASSRVMVSWHKQLHALPDGFVMFAPTKLDKLAKSNLFSLSGKLRMAMDVLIPPNAEPDLDESIASFVKRRLGQEALDRLAEPLIGGIYSGDPEQLSALSTVPRMCELERSFGSIIRGLWTQSIMNPASDSRATRRFSSFKNGMQTLIDALIARLPNDSLRFNISALAVTPGLSKQWRVLCSTGETLEADAVIIATPARHAAGILRQFDSDIAQRLNEIVCNDAVVLNVLFNKADLIYDAGASGFVVPRAEGGLIRACTFSSSKFAHRSSGDTVVLRLYARTAASHATDDDLMIDLLSDCRRFLGVRGKPLLTELCKHPAALPQYTVGHAERMLNLQRRMHRLHGLALAGNAYGGVGIPDCINSANAAAADVALQLFAQAG